MSADLAAASRFQTGNMPVVLVAGHGGDARPETIPDNQQGGPDGRWPDRFTDVLADEVAAGLQLLGKTPYMAVAGISRTKVDLNDPPSEAYVNRPGGEGQAVYDNFHNTLWELGKAAVAQFGWVLIVDLHGFRPRPTLPGEPTDLVLGTLHGQSMPLVGQGAVTRAGLSSFLAGQGWKVKPAQGEPEIVFSGGYIIRRHGKPAAGRYAVQVEVSSPVRRDPDQRLKLVGDLVRYFDVITVFG
jgi:N-formylglutamate amidohydrolase